MHSDVEVTVRDKDGNIKSRSIQKNLRTNGGADFWNTQLFSTSPNAGTKTANYMAVTTDTTAASVTDTILAGEETANNGLRRTGQLVVSHSAGQSASTFTNTFTYIGLTSKLIEKIGLFNDTYANGGTLVLETNLNPPSAVHVSGDTFEIIWTINF
jgi:hypothetical protein